MKDMWNPSKIFSALCSRRRRPRRDAAPRRRGPAWVAQDSRTAAEAIGRLKRGLNRYIKPRVLVLDELGYLRLPRFDLAFLPFEEVRAFVHLLGVAHTAPVLPLAKLSHNIDRSAGRFLWMRKHSPGIYQSWWAKASMGSTCVRCRDRGRSPRRRKRLRIGPASGTEGWRRWLGGWRRRSRGTDRSLSPPADRILDVGIALERMYVLDSKSADLGFEAAVRKLIVCRVHGIRTKNRTTQMGLRSGRSMIVPAPNVP